MLSDPPNRQKIVVQFGTTTIKGYLESANWTSIDEVLRDATVKSLEAIRIRRLDSGLVEEVKLNDAKAVFYVNSFDGDKNHEDLNFYTAAPIIHGVWMRFQFKDGEVMEGIVYNSIRYLVDPGFFVLPTDPDCNNTLVYIVKDSLADHRILGVRQLQQ
jgi:hypothetical protein